MGTCSRAQFFIHDWWLQSSLCTHRYGCWLKILYTPHITPTSAVWVQENNNSSYKSHSNKQNKNKDLYSKWSNITQLFFIIPTTVAYVVSQIIFISSHTFNFVSITCSTASWSLLDEAFVVSWTNNCCVDLKMVEAPKCLVQKRSMGK